MRAWKCTCAQMRTSPCCGLQALGKLKVTLAAGQGPRESAAGFDLLSAKVTGDPAQQGLLTWEGRVPDDVAQVLFSRTCMDGRGWLGGGGPRKAVGGVTGRGRWGLCVRVCVLLSMC